MKTRPWVLACLLAAGFVLSSVSWALTVTGRVQEKSPDHVVVGGTRFLIGEQTRVFYSTKPDARAYPYRPQQLEDVYRVRVSGVRRKAARILILPFGYELGEAR